MPLPRLLSSCCRLPDRWERGGRTCAAVWARVMMASHPDFARPRLPPLLRPLPQMVSAEAERHHRRSQRVVGQSVRLRRAWAPTKRQMAVRVSRTEPRCSGASSRARHRARRSWTANMPPALVQWPNFLQGVRPPSEFWGGGSRTEGGSLFCCVVCGRQGGHEVSFSRISYGWHAGVVGRSMGACVKQLIAGIKKPSHFSLRNGAACLHSGGIPTTCPAGGWGPWRPMCVPCARCGALDSPWPLVMSRGLEVTRSTRSRAPRARQPPQTVPASVPGSSRIGWVDQCLPPCFPASVGVVVISRRSQ
jgi:hypothetical protein